MPENAEELVQQSFLRWLDDQENTRQDKYGMFRDYYNGEHETQLNARQQKFLELHAEQDFSLNFCPLVVDALAERLKVIGFVCEEQEELWEWWRLGRMDAVQGVVHTAAVRDGDTYMIVDYDEEEKRPRFTHENAHDGESGVQIVYSSERRTTPLVAIKRWTIEQGENMTLRRANMYFPNRIEKYQSYTKGWTEWGEDDEEWPVAWTTSDGAPLGIPVVHFKNKDQGYSYGESELEDVLPPQNWLNKTALDLVAAADHTAFQIPWMTGGKPENMSFAIGSWLYSTDPDSKIGAIPAGDISKLLALKESIAADIAKITRTPLSYFQLTGQVAAEGTLKQQEAGLIGKARDRQVCFGNAWEDALAIARRLHNRFGDGKLDETKTLSCTWDDPETRNEKEHLESIKLKGEMGVPEEKLWQEMGYDADAIEKMQEQKAEQQVRETRGLAEALLEQEREFNAGQTI